MGGQAGAAARRRQRCSAHPSRLCAARASAPSPLTTLRAPLPPAQDEFDWPSDIARMYKLKSAPRFLFFVDVRRAGLGQGGPREGRGRAGHAAGAAAVPAADHAPAVRSLLHV